MKGLTVLASRERELSPFSGFEASHLSASPATVMAEPATGTRSPGSWTLQLSGRRWRQPPSGESRGRCGTHLVEIAGRVAPRWEPHDRAKGPAPFLGHDSEGRHYPRSTHGLHNVLVRAC